MEGNYELKFGGQAVGTVRAVKEGLYYRFSCVCRVPGETISKVAVLCGGKEENLGVLVPREDGFGLETRVPVKRLGEGEPEFWVVPNRPVLAGKFVPIKPEEPFAYIERLKDAYLARQGGQVGAVIKEKAGT